MSGEERLRLVRLRELLVSIVQSDRVGGRVTWRGQRVDKPAVDFEVELGEHAYSIQITEEW